MLVTGVYDGFPVDSSAFTSSLVGLMGGDWGKGDGEMREMHSLRP